MSTQLAIAWDDQPLSTGRHHAAPEPHRRCAVCHQRPARFQYRGVVKADRFHTLCFRCYRSAMDSIRNVEPVARLTRTPSVKRQGPARSAPGAVDLPDKYAQLAIRRRRAQIAARHALAAAEIDSHEDRLG